MTFSSAFDWAIFVIIDSLILVTLSILLRRKLYRGLFFFTIYLVVSVISDVGWRCVYLTPAYYKPSWFYVYWCSEFLLSILRLLVFAEISGRVLRRYPTVFSAALWLMTGAATILLSWTAYPAFHGVGHVYHRIVMADQRFALTQAVLLVMLLAVGAYYRITIPPISRLILIGIGVYSSIQIANNEVLVHQLVAPDSISDYVRRASIMVSVAIWTYAVFHWSTVPEPPPTLIPQITYENFSPQLHGKMQELNDRLAKLFSRS